MQEALLYECYYFCLCGFLKQNMQDPEVSILLTRYLVMALNISFLFQVGARIWKKSGTSRNYLRGLDKLVSIINLCCLTNAGQDYRTGYTNKICQIRISGPA